MRAESRSWRDLISANLRTGCGYDKRLLPVQLLLDRAILRGRCLSERAVEEVEYSASVSPAVSKIAFDVLGIRDEPEFLRSVRGLVQALCIIRVNNLIFLAVDQQDRSRSDPPDIAYRLDLVEVIAGAQP